MRIVEWTDDDGYYHLSQVRDADSDESAPKIGIPCDPPDVNLIDWEAVKRDTNNLLVKRKLISMADINKSLEHLRSIPQAVLYKRLIDLFTNSKQEEP